MPREHEVYRAIVKAIKEGKLKEPFTKEDFRRACPNFGEGTYNTFLWKHRKGNPGRNSELFEKVAPGKFVVINHLNTDWIVKLRTITNFIKSQGLTLWTYFQKVVAIS